jgi:hypothetical protein
MKQTPVTPGFAFVGWVKTQHRHANVHTQSLNRRERVDGNVGF